MSWVEAVPCAVGVMYASTAVGYWLHGQMGFALAYGAYALANVGLVMAAVEGRGGS